MRRYYEEKNRFRVDAQMKIGLEEIPFEEVPPPPVATVFLQQHVGPAGRPLVKEKDHVKTGQKLSDGDEPLTVPVHSPVTGSRGVSSDLSPTTPSLTLLEASFAFPP